MFTILLKRFSRKYLIMGYRNNCTRNHLLYIMCTLRGTAWTQTKLIQQIIPVCGKTLRKTWKLHATLLKFEDDILTALGNAVIIFAAKQDWIYGYQIISLFSLLPLRRPTLLDGAREGSVALVHALQAGPRQEVRLSRRPVHPQLRGRDRGLGRQQRQLQGSDQREARVQKSHRGENSHVLIREWQVHIENNFNILDLVFVTQEIG